MGNKHLHNRPKPSHSCCHPLPYYPLTYHTVTSALFVLLALTISILGTGCGGGTRGTNISGTGTVRSAKNEPVANATVEDPGTGNTSTTDSNGDFELKNLGLRSGATTSLTVTRPDGLSYTTNTFSVTGDSGTLAITLPEEGGTAAATFTPDDSYADDTSKDDGATSNDTSFDPQPTPTPTPSARPTPTPSATPTRPTPSPSESPDGSDGENNANARRLAQCVAERFTIRGIPDLSCEHPCLNDPGSYVTDCRNFISYLSQVFLPFCANEPCAEECELTQLLFSDTRTGAIVAQGYENANCGRAQQGGEESNGRRPTRR
jgi:hypothetical protein